jgi:hypothetical protein
MKDTSKSHRVSLTENEMIAICEHTNLNEDHFALVDDTMIQLCHSARLKIQLVLFKVTKGIKTTGYQPVEVDKRVGKEITFESLTAEEGIDSDAFMAQLLKEQEERYASKGLDAEGNPIEPKE